MILKKKYTSTVSFLIIVTAIYFSFSSLMPQKISDYSTPLTEFSTERALVHLEEITKKPHFVGTNEHEKVQFYIVKQLLELGIETEVQDQVAFNKNWLAGANTQNILARIKGTDNSKALLLLTHYDSQPHSSLGASDAGSGVVTILEGLRAYLATNKQPKNDIIILFSDAEELGLLGARAFVNNHLWAKDVGLVLNFEARGSGGPSSMLIETNGGNKNLIRNFIKANPKFPVGNSFLYSIYKMLPNDTDLTIFREDGDIDGFNFAFFSDHFDYHTAQDSYDRLDKNSLEHQASYLMPLLNYFGDADLTNLKSETDFIYFNLPIIGMVYYPFSLIIPFLIIAILLFFGLIFYGVKKHKLNVKYIFIGFVPFIVSLLLSGILAYFGWKLLLKIHPQYNDILQGFMYNGYLYIAAFSTITIAISFLVYHKYFKDTFTINLIIAPICFWILINIVAAIFLKGAGYFIIAVLYGLISLTILIVSKKSVQYKQILLTILSIPIFLIFVPLIQLFPVGLGLKALIGSTTLIVLLFGLLIPVFSIYKNSKSLGKLFLVLSVIIFISASFKSSYNIDRKMPNSIIYLLDVDKNNAYWASYDAKIDEFTKQFLGENPIEGSIDSSISKSKYYSTVKLHQTAAVQNIAHPEVNIISDTTIYDDRTVHFIIEPKRKANRIELITNKKIQLKTFKVNGVSLSAKKGSDYVLTRDKNKTLLQYYLIDNQEILEIELSISKNDPIDLTIYEASYDLLTNPNFSITPRNKIMMPKPFVVNDAIVVKKQVNLN